MIAASVRAKPEQESQNELLLVRLRAQDRVTLPVSC